MHRSAGVDGPGWDAPVVESVQRACRLLRSVRAGHSPSVRDAATMLDAAPSTAHRLLAALSYDGFNDDDPARGEEAGRSTRSTRRHGSTTLSTQRGAPPLAAVHRALVLVKALEGGQVLSVTEAADLLVVAPATAYRLLSTLRQEGLATQQHDRRYRAGVGLSSSAHQRLGRDDLQQCLNPALRQLADKVGETIHVWALHGPFVRLFDALPGAAADAIPHDKWRRVPAHATAGGRAMLAELPNTRVVEIHERGLPPWPAARVTSVQSLKRRLSIVRRRGYETNFEEGAQGSSGLAVCVRDPWRRPIAGIGVAVPSARFRRSDLPTYHRALEATRAVAERAVDDLCTKSSAIS